MLIFNTLISWNVPVIRSGGGGGTWVDFCCVCAAGLSEPLPHYSLFCDLSIFMS